MLSDLMIAGQVMCFSAMVSAFCIGPFNAVPTSISVCPGGCEHCDRG